MLNMDVLPRLLLKFNDGVSGKHFEDEEVNVDEYIGVKSYKAKGKRLSAHDVNYYEFLEPFAVPEEPLEEEPEEPHADNAETAEIVEESSSENSNIPSVYSDPNDNDNNNDGQLTLF